MRVIQKMSSVCEYCRCSAAVTMVRMLAEFVDSVTRHGRNLQTFERCLRIVLCVYKVCVSLGSYVGNRRRIHFT